MTGVSGRDGWQKSEPPGERALIATINPAEIDSRPEVVSKDVTMADGTPVRLRPLARSDAAMLGQYLVCLGEETKLRFSPHPFDRHTADAICRDIDSAKRLIIVGTVAHGQGERIVAYFMLDWSPGDGEQRRYGSLNVEETAAVAPSLADDFQGKGLGTLVMQHVIGIARRAQQRKIVLRGGVQATNARAIRFYQKNGFRIVREFKASIGNYDMELTLRPTGDHHDH